MSTDIAQRTPQQELIAQVRSEQFTGQVALVVPEGISPQRVSRVAITALLDNADLAKVAAANPDSFFAAVFKCAADGLVPDGRQAALIVYGNKVGYVPMIGGLRDKLAEFGWHLTAGVVYDHDEFDYDPSPGVQTVTHRPPKLGVDRGERLGAWALVVHRDGRRVLAVLNSDDVARCKAAARTDKVWKEHTEAMWAKSAGKKAAKETPLGGRETERIRRLLDDQGFDSDPTSALYGVASGELPPAAADERQQADPAAPPAGPVPGGFLFDDSPAPAEPPVDDGGVEPKDTGVSEGSPAANMVVPLANTHAYHGFTVAQIGATPEGRDWLRTQVLSEGVPEDNDVRVAVAKWFAEQAAS